MALARLAAAALLLLSQQQLEYTVTRLLQQMMMLLCQNRLLWVLLAHSAPAWALHPTPALQSAATHQHPAGSSKATAKTSQANLAPAGPLQPMC